ncbi:RNA polymerase sigma factor [Nonomuraea sp. SYSU D8015]|uniref:RNA polymerase sigma factor n=1 Tax=Nonomuraea sp. SYSU D8015 TaxID=2593644 RepID=UPI001CB6EE1C|nr:sigma-70 family RNA polymerase sigma factor [Nonomuraea sp. SYSU D8015]
MNSSRPDGARQAVVTFDSHPVEPREQDDPQLLQAIARGDRGALVTLYQRHAGAVLAHLTLVTGDHGLSEEVLQDTMLAVWRGAGSYRSLSSVRSWIIAIARRQARDRLRRRRVTMVGQESLAERAATGPGPEDIALDRAKAGEVAEAIKALGVPHREVLGLVFGTGLTLAETATALEIPVGTVKSRLAAARAALARAMTERGYA